MEPHGVRHLNTRDAGLGDGSLPEAAWCFEFALDNTFLYREDTGIQIVCAILREEEVATCAKVQATRRAIR